MKKKTRHFKKHIKLIKKLYLEPSCCYCGKDAVTYTTDILHRFTGLCFECYDNEDIRKITEFTF